MSDNAAIAQRWFQEVWREGGEKTVDELLARDAIGWMEGGLVIKSPEDFKAARRNLLEIFPDLAIKVDDVIEQDNKVAVRWSVKATHLGWGLGFDPTKRSVAFRGMTWIEIRNGQVIHGWDSWNLGGLIDSLKGPTP